jgi:hypothetical protein
MKKVKSIFKKLGHVYTKGFYEMYGPCLKVGVNPFV